MNDFFTKEDYDFQDILSLISSEAEESINLEFKAAGALAKTDEKRREITKDVAAMANSDGGIIVYGMSEIGHKAHEVSFVDGNQYTKEWLEQVINSGIQRHIEGLRIYPVRKDGDIEKTVYVVKIPYSYNTPHINKDKRYYKRFNFEATTMEEYEVRQLYDRKGMAKLEVVAFKAIEDPSEGDEEHMAYRLVVRVANTGMAVEELYKVNVEIGYQWIGDLKFAWSKLDRPEEYDFTRSDQSVRISHLGRFPIFPGEKVDAFRIKVILPRKGLEEALEQIRLGVTTLYAGGSAKMNPKRMGRIVEADTNGNGCKKG